MTGDNGNGRRFAQRLVPYLTLANTQEILLPKCTGELPAWRPSVSCPLPGRQ